MKGGVRLAASETKKSDELNPKYPLLMISLFILIVAILGRSWVLLPIAAILLTALLLTSFKIEETDGELVGAAFENITIPPGDEFDKIVFKLHGLDTYTMKNRAKAILADFGFNEFTEEKAFTRNGIDFILHSKSNEFAGAEIRFSMWFIQLDESVIKCTIVLSSENVTTVDALMEQLKQVIGPVRCPVCKSVLTQQQEIDFNLYGELTCQNCNTSITKLEQDEILCLDGE